jgi:hypothetical protein
MRFSRLPAFILLAAAPLTAQEAKSRFGLGATFNPGGFVVPGESQVILTQTGFNNILIPIRKATVTIEPEIGLLRVVTEDEIQTGPTTFTKVKATVMNNRIGVGLLKHLKRTENFEPYVAPRVGFIFASSEEPSGLTTTSKTSSTNFYVTGGAGGQYFFSDHFTLGGEAQLTYTKLGKPKVTGNPAFSGPGGSGSMISTLGLIALRWYY